MSEEHDVQEKPKQLNTTLLAMGVGVGAGLGAGLGAAFEKVGLGVALGAGLGSAIGVMLSVVFAQSSEEQTKPEDDSQQADTSSE